MRQKTYKPDDARAAKARSALRRIQSELNMAIGYERQWKQIGNRKDVIDRINQDLNCAQAFKVIRDAVHSSLVSALMRIFDNDATQNASLAFMFRALDEPRVRVALRFSANSLVHIEAAKKLFSAASTQGYIRHLKKLRNQHLGHSAISPKPTTAKYGQERKLLLRTIKIVEELDKAIGIDMADFKTVREVNGRWAKIFWTRAAQGISESKSMPRAGGAERRDRDREMKLPPRASARGR